MGGELWAVESGPCTLHNNGCMRSPNYPREYGDDEVCIISINGIGSISATNFKTEEGYDFLYLGDVNYSGNQGPNSVTPTQAIVWSTDGSITERPGWELCPEEPPELWAVESGPCTLHNNGCMRSPNYPRNYSDDEGCIISINGIGSISATNFKTEEGYDFLYVNDVAYSGNQGPNSVTPTQAIVWSTDGSITERPGWELCPEEPPEPVGCQSISGWSDNKCARVCDRSYGCKRKCPQSAKERAHAFSAFQLTRVGPIRSVIRNATKGTAATASVRKGAQAAHAVRTATGVSQMTPCCLFSVDRDRGPNFDTFRRVVLWLIFSSSRNGIGSV